MIYKIVFLPRAAKEFKKLPTLIGARIAATLENLSKNPYTGKPLQAEYKGLHSDKVGDYRIIYKVVREKTLLVVFKIGHRREIYR